MTCMKFAVSVALNKYIMTDQKRNITCIFVVCSDVNVFANSILCIT